MVTPAVQELILLENHQVRGNSVVYTIDTSVLILFVS